MTTRVGTPNFVDFDAAVAYYKPYGFDAKSVDRKLREGEIHIGAPRIMPGQKLTVIPGEGRYQIEGEPVRVVLDGLRLDARETATVIKRTLTTPIQLLCPHCGSTNIQADAHAGWNVEKQEWELTAAYDSRDCGNCGESDITPHDIPASYVIDDDADPAEEFQAGRATVGAVRLHEARRKLMAVVQAGRNNARTERDEFEAILAEIEDIEETPEPDDPRVREALGLPNPPDDTPSLDDHPMAIAAAAEREEWAGVDPHNLTTAQAIVALHELRQRQAAADTNAAENYDDEAADRWSFAIGFAIDAINALVNAREAT